MTKSKMNFSYDCQHPKVSDIPDYWVDEFEHLTFWSGDGDGDGDGGKRKESLSQVHSEIRYQMTCHCGSYRSRKYLQWCRNCFTAVCL